jgi:ATP-dependent DNA helicase RecG
MFADPANTINTMSLSVNELAALLRELESDRVERKESASDTDKLSQAVCAFANDLPAHGKPGVLFVGVTDDGRHTGLPVTDSLLRRLADLRDQGNILPPPSMSVQKVNERRRALDLPFDARPLPGATLDDLDLDVFERQMLPQLAPPELLAENGRTIEQRLTALRLLSPDGTPTTAGILCSGRDPEYWLPGAYVQFLRLDGGDLTAPVKDEKRLSGRLTDVLRQLDELLTLNITTAVQFVSSPREDRAPDYPLTALQQVARNAVMHRSYEHTNAPVRITWYADRVEVVNPGGPFGVVNISNFGTGMTDYRNPALADLMRSLGYVQRFGAGIPVAKRSLAANHNPPPAFEVTPTHVAVIIGRRS